MLEGFVVRGLLNNLNEITDEKYYREKEPIDKNVSNDILPFLIHCYIVNTVKVHE